MTTTSDIKAEAMRLAVAKGAALLDERVPCWAERIDLDELDLVSSSECVLGQLFADRATQVLDTGYQAGLEVLSGYELLDPRRWQFAVEHGFAHVDDTGNYRAWDRLLALWVTEIEVRTLPREAAR